MIGGSFMASSAPPLTGRLWAYWKHAFPVLVPALVVLGVLLTLPPVQVFAPRSPVMLYGHLVLEVVSVIVAVLIAMLAWHTLDKASESSSGVLAAGFLTVAALDLVHGLTYDGMLPLITENSTGKAIFFWLAARTASAVTLLLVALGALPQLPRWQALAWAALVSALVFWAGTFHLDAFPALYLEGRGLSPFKAAYELGTSALMTVTALLFIARAPAGAERRAYTLATACLLMALGELVFTTYLLPYDLLNAAGHLFKIASYVFLYRALFAATVQQPYTLARKAGEALQSTATELARQRAALEVTLASMSQGIAKFDADGRLAFYNPRARELLELPDELLARHPHIEELAKFQTRRGDFDDISGVSDPQIREWIGTGQHRLVPQTYVRKSPSGAWVEVRTDYLPDGGMVRTYTDMSGYFRITETLQTERERLSNLLEGTRAGSWYWNAQTGDAEVDERWAAIVGYTAADYRAEHGQNWQHRVHPDDLALVRSKMSAHLRGETEYLEVEFRAQHKDGHWVWIQSRGQVHARGPDGRALLVSGIHIDISSLKMTQEALVEASTRLRENTRLLDSTMDSIGQGITVMSEEGRILAYNQRVLELLDLPESLMAAQPSTYDLTQYQFERGDFGDGAQLVESHARAYVSQRGAGPAPTSYLRRTPAGKWIEVQTQTLATGGMVRTFTDVTNYVQAQEALQSSEARARVITDSARDPIVSTDTDFVIRYANPAATSVFGLEEAHLVGLPLARLFPEREREATLAQLRAALEDRGPRRGLPRLRWARRADGTEFMADISMASGVVGGETVNTLMLRDVSERMEAEAEIRRLNESLELRVSERTAALERSMRDMEAISYSIAHDLRAPLQAVNGFATLLEQREQASLSAQSRSMLARIQGASRNMAQMIDDLLALFRVVRAELVMTPVDMNKLARDAVQALDTVGAQVVVGPLPAALGDATLLRQVFMNLVDNAVKYSRGVPSPRVEVGWEPSTSAWFVRDNGVGFDMAYADKLFGVFQRLHAVADFQGSGVGLSVVSRIVERHGGRIWAEAAVGQGATFRFTLATRD